MKCKLICLLVVLSLSHVPQAKAQQVIGNTCSTVGWTTIQPNQIVYCNTSNLWSLGEEITSTGNVGIGTPNPLAVLHTVVTSSSSGILLEDTAGSGSYVDLAASPYASSAWTVGAPAAIRFTDARNYSSNIDFMTKAPSSNGVLSSQMTILSTGNVGIGTTNPLALLTVGNNNQFTVSVAGNVIAQSATVGSTSIAPPIAVSGSGGPSSPNGVYSYGGQYNGKNYYLSAMGQAIYWSSYWFIGPSLGNNSPGWYNGTNSATPPTGTVWTDWSGGTGTVTTSINSSNFVVMDAAGNITAGGGLAVNGTGTSYVSGSLGIGTSSPQAALDVNGYARLTLNSSQPVACSGTNAGSFALNHLAQTCACNGSTWVFSDSTGASCSW